MRNRSDKVLNYTTTISVEKSVAEIQSMLVDMGARSILSDYDASGMLTSISFQVINPVHGKLSFMLPANIRKLHAVMMKKPRIPGKFKTMEQAARVAWRILKDWIEAQLARIETESVTIDQVFLAYVQNDKGETLYELMNSGGGFKKLTSGSGGEGS